MPAIYALWSLGICHIFGNNPFKMFPFADFNRPKLDVCTNLQKKHCIGERYRQFTEKALHWRANSGNGAPT